jgi:hypothetical protein
MHNDVAAAPSYLSDAPYPTYLSGEVVAIATAGKEVQITVMGGPQYVAELEFDPRLVLLPELLERLHVIKK